MWHLKRLTKKIVGRFLLRRTIRAAVQGRTDEVRRLLDRGVSLNPRRLRAPLLAATMYSHTGVVRALLEHGPNVNVRLRIPLEETALILSVYHRRPIEITKLLLEHGADVNLTCAGGFTALMMASVCGRPDMVRLLLQYGADVNVESSDGRTALSVATKPEVVSLLREYGAN